MFKKSLALLLTATMLLGMGLTAQAKTLDKMDQGTIRRSGSIIYVEHEIDHGLEFDIISRNAKGNDINGLIKGANAGIQAVKPGSDIRPMTHLTDSGYYNPNIPIQTESSGRTVYGYWWGGLIDDVGTIDEVASATIATSSDSQSKASVRPGLTASWYSGGWKNNGTISCVMKECGLAGNQAKWDLR